MLRSRLFVVASWVLTTFIVGAAIFSTPYMRGVLRGEAVESAQQSIGALVMISLVCGWPWLAALALRPSEGNKQRQYFFSSMSVLVAALFYFPISTGHDFSIGLYTTLCVLCIWVLYPFTRSSRPQ